MIGGADIVVAVPTSEAAKRMLVAAIVDHWPEAIVEDARSSGPPVRMQLVARTSELPDEILVYKDGHSRAAWEREGAVDDTADTMIHVLFGNDEITFVVESRTASDTAAIVNELRKDLLSQGAMIRDDFFGGPSTPEEWVKAA